MSVRRCEYCETVYVQWLRCRDGRRRLFEATPVDVDQVGGRFGWVPGRATINGRTQVVLAPITQVSTGKADAARRVMVLHDCEAFRELHEKVFTS